MSSTRKSTRVRVPKIREDAATPTKRSKLSMTAVPTAPAEVQLPAETGINDILVIAESPSQTPMVVSSPSVSETLMISEPSLVIETGTESELGGLNGEEPDVNVTGQPDGAAEELEKVATAVFKDPNFVHSSIGAAGSKRNRVWKNLKQITVAERSLPWQSTDVTYASIDAPPSFKPAKKYSDLSGFESNYTDPRTMLRFSGVDEYKRARSFPNDIVTGYLALRKASGPVP